MVTDRRIIIIAGPNGAGKTTFAREFLPAEGKCPVFINADLIAAGLSPFNPETEAMRAGRIMLQEIARRVEAGESFAFETTLSGRGYARMIPEWRRAGYELRLVYLSLETADAAVARVAKRVSLGGHGIPEPVIRARFNRSMQNFNALYKPIVDSWILYENSGSRPVFVEEG